MTFFITSILHENCRHFRSDEKLHDDDFLMCFDDFCRSLVLPSEAKVADRSDRVPRFVLVCIERWDVRRQETQWVPP